MVNDSRTDQDHPAALLAVPGRNPVVLLDDGVQRLLLYPSVPDAKEASRQRIQYLLPLDKQGMARAKAELSRLQCLDDDRAERA